jgi:hypothetical protein
VRVAIGLAENDALAPIAETVRKLHRLKQALFARLKDVDVEVLRDIVLADAGQAEFIFRIDNDSQQLSTR